MILCRKNKEVREIQGIGYDKVQTIHQAKGLEYPYVIVTDFEVRGVEDINLSYVAMTRAEDGLLAANYDAFIKILERLKQEKKLNNASNLF
jgi:ATP-dependent exoDNAse (exonuclease V) beta subunit